MNYKREQLSVPDKLPPATLSLSDELWEAIEAMKYTDYATCGTSKPTGLVSTQWIHLADAVSRRTITPAEAYDCIRLGYVAEHLKVRKSAYSHLL